MASPQPQSRQEMKLEIDLLRAVLNRLLISGGGQGTSGNTGDLKTPTQTKAGSHPSCTQPTAYNHKQAPLNVNEWLQPASMRDVPAKPTDASSRVTNVEPPNGSETERGFENAAVGRVSKEFATGILANDDLVALLDGDQEMNLYGIACENYDNYHPLNNIVDRFVYGPGALLHILTKSRETHQSQLDTELSFSEICRRHSSAHSDCPILRDDYAIMASEHESKAKTESRIVLELDSNINKIRSALLEHLKLFGGHSNDRNQAVQPDANTQTSFVEGRNTTEEGWEQSDQGTAAEPQGVSLW